MKEGACLRGEARCGIPFLPRCDVAAEGSWNLQNASGLPETKPET